jgi:hypothetical protein
MVETPADQPGGGQEMVAGWRSARDTCGPIAGPPSTVAITAAATAMIAPAKGFDCACEPPSRVCSGWRLRRSGAAML